MKSTVTKNSDTEISITIIAEPSELSDVKAITLKRLGKDVKVAGFREGKAPADLIEKHVNRDILLNEFLDDAMSRLYAEAATQHKLRPVSRPQAEMKKFVPFTELEFSVVTEVLPPIKLGDYKKLTAKPEKVEVTNADINEVLENLRQRLAKKADVDRASAKGDQIWIDFAGTDDKGKEVAGASGKDYPLNLGSNTFIPGFEENLIGLKKGEDKEFTITFPKDYGVKALRSRKVTFKVTVKKVQSVTLPEVNEELAKEAGPFQSLEELKTDIKKQLMTEKQSKAQQNLQNALVEELIEKSDVTIPAVILESYEQDLMNDLQQNLVYRGITYPEYLEQTEQTEEEHKANEITPLAIKRAKAGVLLTEVAESENLTVTPEEVEARVAILKGQYNDDQMQSQLATDEAQRDIAAQLLSEKTMTRLMDLCTPKSKK